MKTQIAEIVVLVLIALGSIGCSSSPSVYYWGDKAYARDPETGKIMSWEHKQSGKDAFEHFDSKPTFDIRSRADGLSPQVSLNLY
jgi:hypothetical protein